jgi:hypothetical protein
MLYRRDFGTQPYSKIYVIKGNITNVNVVRKHLYLIFGPLNINTSTYLAISSIY